MPIPTIQIGSIGLLDFEVPESVRFGGHQRLVVHKLAGGRRIVSRLGPDDAEVGFSGVFSGASAENRARALDELRLSGEIVWLAWESCRRQVVVKSLLIDYHSPWWIPFQISCLVIHQAINAAAQTSHTSAALSNDLCQALLASDGTTVSLAELQAAFAATNITAAGSDDQMNALSTVNTTLIEIDAEATRESAELDIQLPLSSSPDGFVQAYAAMVSSAASLAALVNTRSYVGRIAVNLNDPNG